MPWAMPWATLTELTKKLTPFYTHVELAMRDLTPSYTHEIGNEKITYTHVNEKVNPFLHTQNCHGNEKIHTCRIGNEELTPMNPTWHCSSVTNFFSLLEIKSQLFNNVSD